MINTALDFLFLSGQVAIKQILSKARLQNAFSLRITWTCDFHQCDGSSSCKSYIKFPGDFFKFIIQG